jgi:probable rRNA maturation factor
MTTISILNSQKDLKVSKKEVKHLFQLLIAYKKIQVDELEVSFITDSAMKKKHQELFDDPSSTDCITCPIDDPYEENLAYCVLGSCFICPKTAIKFASEHKKDPYEELTLYCVHCFLHLIGYDDIDPIMRKKMRAQERSCLAFLKKEGAYLKSS